MSLSFYSQNWYRVAALKLKLRRHVALHRHVYRGDTWFVMQDHATGQYHRFDSDAQHIIGLMDGEQTLQQIWEIACVRLGDDMPTQDEIIELVSKLYRSNLVQADLPPDVAELVERGREFRRRKLLQQLRSPLGIRIPLVDPNRFLTITEPYVRIIFTHFAALLWLVVVAVAVMLAAMHWQTLTNNVSDQILSVENLVALWFVYPLVKAIHELGHGYAVKHWGGEVHEMGIMLLVFVPVPYVDASSALAFNSKYQRALVGAAGIVVEVFIAAVAMLIWVTAEPGAVRSIAFNVMMIAGVSTVLFNGNPLLRFDAYYVLCDMIESPNLGMRGNRYVGYLAKRFLFSVKDAKAPYAAPGEPKWLTTYAIASYIYRLFIMAGIVLFVASKYLIIGVILAIWSIGSAFLFPIYQTIIKSFKDPQLRRRPKTFIAITASIVAAVVLLVGVVPMPLDTYAQGIVAADHDARFYAPVNGFVTRILTPSDTDVSTGTALIQAVDPQLDSDIQVLKASLREAQARLEASIKDRTQYKVIEAEIEYLNKELARLAERRDSLTFRSPRSGRFILPQAVDLPGQFVKRGQLLGYVVNRDDLKISVPIPQDHLDLVRTGVEHVQARFVSHNDVIYEGHITQQVPAASRDLPSAILTTDGGGLIARDPKFTDGIRSFEYYFLIQVDLPGASKHWLDERVYVLFEHPPEALIFRWYRSVRRVFLKRFAV